MKRVLIICIILAITSQSLLAQPSYESFQTNVGNTASAAINKPAGTIANDLLIVGITYEKGSSEVITPPVGWLLIIKNDNSTDAGLAAYYKVAGGSEPASYTFTLANGSKWSIGCSRISNVNTTIPIGASGGNTGNNTSVTAPSITTTANNSMVLCYHTNKKASTYTPDGTTTERYDAPNSADGSASNMLATFVQATAGATGNKTATSSDLESWSAVQIAIQPDVVLPVELLYFEAAIESDVVLLNWATATEINNEFYTVEKSLDGLHFQEVTKIEGAGNSDEVNNYMVVDGSPYNGISYYRIKQTDFDGQFEYSDLAVVDFKSGTEIMLFPNPFTEQITIKCPNLLGDGTLIIKDTKGQTVKVVDHIKTKNIVIKRDYLPAGLYFLQLKDGNTMLLSKKIMIRD